MFFLILNQYLHTINTTHYKTQQYNFENIKMPLSKRELRKQRKQNKHNHKLSGDDEQEQHLDTHNLPSADKILQNLESSLNPYSDEDITVSYTNANGNNVLNKGNNIQQLSDNSISVTGFSMSRQSNRLLEKCDFTLTLDNKYGLVGPNGSGKSTLLKALAGGHIPIPKSMDMLYVEQDVPLDGRTAVQLVMSADSRREYLEHRLSLLQQYLDVDMTINTDADTNTDAILSDYSNVVEELNAIKSDAAEGRARAILHGLGFSAEMQDYDVSRFSGGWRMRVSLARALFLEPTVLLLDEPTNHLDLEAVLWLTNYLSKHWRRNKMIVIVSHDQEFLDEICTNILLIDRHTLQMTTYKCSYYKFTQIYMKDMQHRQLTWEKQQKRLHELKKQGKSRKQAIEAIGGASALLPRPHDYQVAFKFPNIESLGTTTLAIECKNICFQWPDASAPILLNVNLGIAQMDRICIVGPNGAGKSTLLNILSGKLEPTNGSVTHYRKLRIGILDQHTVESLPEDETPVEHLLNLSHQYVNDETGGHPYLKGGSQHPTQQWIRNMLGMFNMEGRCHLTKCGKLSGGQRTRVILCRLAIMRPHVLMLDEPTNNLDIESINALIDVLNLYNGAVICISHDVRLITSLNAKLWLVNKGTCSPINGGIDEYRSTIELESI